MAQRRKRNRKWLWSLVIVLLVVGLITGVLIWQNNNHDAGNVENKGSESNNVIEKDAEEEVDSTAETPTLPQDDTYTTETIEKQKIVQYEGDDPNIANDLSGVITYAGVTGDTLMIRVSIDQYLTSGTCELSLIRSGVTIYTDKANIVGDVSTATCEGFNVPTKNIGGGNMEIVINLNSGDRVGVIRGEVEL